MIFTPWRGERLTIAWLTGLAMLETGKWIKMTEFRQSMEDASDLQTATVKQMVRAMHKDKVIVCKGKWDAKLREDFRSVKLNPKMPAATRDRWMNIPETIIVKRTLKISELFSDHNVRARSESRSRQGGGTSVASVLNEVMG